MFIIWYLVVILGVSSPWLSTEEAAEYLGIGKTKLYNLAQTGQIPVSKVGKKWVMSQQDVGQQVH